MSFHLFDAWALFGMPIALKRFTPAAKALIQETSRKIFGNLPIVNNRTGFKVLRKKPTGPLAVNHFPIETTNDFRKISPGYKTELEDRRQEKILRLRRAGNFIPKKGQGRRSKKK